jgi:hypothetical protein
MLRRRAACESHRSPGSSRRHRISGSPPTRPLG